MREDGSLSAQFDAAEKDGKGMAHKIFTEAKPFLKAYIERFGITIKQDAFYLPR